MNTFIEVACRFGIMLSIAITMNKTVWYQNLNVNLVLNDPTAWFFSLGIILGIVWCCKPICDDFNIKGSDNKSGCTNSEDGENK